MKITSTNKMIISTKLTDIVQQAISIYEIEALKYFKIDVKMYNDNFQRQIDKYAKVRHTVIFLSVQFVNRVLAQFDENIKVRGFNYTIIADCFKIERSNVTYVAKRMSKKIETNTEFADAIAIINFRTNHILTLEQKSFELIKTFFFC